MPDYGHYKDNTFYTGVYVGRRGSRREKIIEKRKIHKKHDYFFSIIEADEYLNGNF